MNGMKFGLNYKILGVEGAWLFIAVSFLRGRTAQVFENTPDNIPCLEPGVDRH
jgi:hypothetical protein